ncbi:MAG: teichoic acid ABC transporter permease [Deltaproteobacteria bacterium HGW-Deltaproteobacteria-4]|nr:MAG: teichoic acid ABC transporter permease [Deltaproteobacteria bacterium HGW-Deltaproteobacteria-4]
MKSLKMFLGFLTELFSKRHIITELTKNDFRKKYLGSYLGILWAFVHPTIYIAIVWFVFQVGFRSQPMDNFPFVLWMLAGIIPWFFFSECLASATNSIMENAFLVKKVAFSMGMLPLVKILSSLIIHCFFIAVIFVMFTVYGYPPSIYNLQVFYYLFSAIVLLLGLSWLTSSLTLFLKDTGQIVTMILQFAFWMTPIFWSPKHLPPKIMTLIKLNPVYYIVEGYRQSFIYKTWFWEQNYMMTLYFWCVTLFFFFLGAVVFRRLRPHFADVL